MLTLICIQFTIILYCIIKPSPAFECLFCSRSPAEVAPTSPSPAPPKVSTKTKKVIATGGIKLPPLGEAVVQKPTTADAPAPQEEPQNTIVRIRVLGKG